MLIEINTRARTLYVWSDTHIYNDANFEQKHPRDNDGKFTRGGTMHGPGGKSVPGRSGDGMTAGKTPIAAHVDFHEIPRGVAKTITNAIAENIKMYPFMADHFSFIGSTQAKLAKDLGDNIEDNDDAVEAFYRPEPQGRRGRLCFSLRGLRVSQILPDDNKYHPIGTNNPKGIADHEFGHALWHRLGMDGPQQKGSELAKYVMDYMKTHSKQSIKENLSYYANTGPGEFFAEAFSELKNNPNPRPVARQIGQLLDAEIKRQKLKNGK